MPFGSVIAKSSMMNSIVVFYKKVNAKNPSPTMESLLGLGGNLLWSAPKVAAGFMYVVPMYTLIGGLVIETSCATDHVLC